MNPRELALELMELGARERERLLGELPANRRVEMRELIREARLLAQDPTTPFELQLQAQEKSEPGASDLARLNDGQLRLLLEREGLAVQQRIIAALRNGDIDRWPPAMSRVVLAWLRSHQQTSSIAVPERRVPEPRWRRWMSIWRKSA